MDSNVLPEAYLNFRKRFKGYQYDYKKMGKENFVIRWQTLVPLPLGTTFLHPDYITDPQNISNDEKPLYHLRDKELHGNRDIVLLDSSKATASTIKLLKNISKEIYEYMPYILTGDVGELSQLGFVPLTEIGEAFANMYQIWKKDFAQLLEQVGLSIDTSVMFPIIAKRYEEPPILITDFNLFDTVKDSDEFEGEKILDMIHKIEQAAENEAFREKFSHAQRTYHAYMQKLKLLLIIGNIVRQFNELQGKQQPPTYADIKQWIKTYVGRYILPLGSSHLIDIYKHYIDYYSNGKFNDIHRSSEWKYSNRWKAYYDFADTLPSKEHFVSSAPQLEYTYMYLSPDIFTSSEPDMQILKQAITNTINTLSTNSHLGQSVSPVVVLFPHKKMVSNYSLYTIYEAHNSGNLEQVSDLMYLLSAQANYPQTAYALFDTLLPVGQELIKNLSTKEFKYAYEEKNGKRKLVVTYYDKKAGKYKSKYATDAEAKYIQMLEDLYNILQNTPHKFADFIRSLPDNLGMFYTTLTYLYHRYKQGKSESKSFANLLDTLEDEDKTRIVNHLYTFRKMLEHDDNQKLLHFQEIEVDAILSLNELSVITEMLQNSKEQSDTALPHPLIIEFFELSGYKWQQLLQVADKDTNTSKDKVSPHAVVKAMRSIIDTVATSGIIPQEYTHGTPRFLTSIAYAISQLDIDSNEKQRAIEDLKQGKISDFILWSILTDDTLRKQSSIEVQKGNIEKDRWEDVLYALLLGDVAVYEDTSSEKYPLKQQMFEKLREQFTSPEIHLPLSPSTDIYLAYILMAKPANGVWHYDEYGKPMFHHRITNQAFSYAFTLLLGIYPTNEEKLAYFKEKDNSPPFTVNKTVKQMISIFEEIWKNIDSSNLSTRRVDDIYLTFVNYLVQLQSLKENSPIKYQEFINNLAWKLIEEGENDLLPLYKGVPDFLSVFLVNSVFNHLRYDNVQHIDDVVSYISKYMENIENIYVSLVKEVEQAKKNIYEQIKSEREKRREQASKKNSIAFEAIDNLMIGKEPELPEGWTYSVYTTGPEYWDNENLPVITEYFDGEQWRTDRAIADSLPDDTLGDDAELIIFIVYEVYDDNHNLVVRQKIANYNVRHDDLPLR